MQIVEKVAGDRLELVERVAESEEGRKGGGEVRNLLIFRRFEAGAGFVALMVVGRGKRRRGDAAGGMIGLPPVGKRRRRRREKRGRREGGRGRGSGGGGGRGGRGRVRKESAVVREKGQGCRGGRRRRGGGGWIQKVVIVEAHGNDVVHHEAVGRPGNAVQHRRHLDELLRLLIVIRRQPLNEQPVPVNAVDAVALERERHIVHSSSISVNLNGRRLREYAERAGGRRVSERLREERSLRGRRVREGSGRRGGRGGSVEEVAPAGVERRRGKGVNSVGGWSNVDGRKVLRLRGGGKGGRGG